MKAWGDYINSNGGLACRKVVVKEGDAKLSPTDAANAVVGRVRRLDRDGRHDRAVPAGRRRAMDSCKDKAGAATGLPDIAELQTEVAQQCSPVSFATLPTGSACPYSGTGPRDLPRRLHAVRLLLQKYGATALHGVFVVPKDLPSTIASTMPIFRAENQMGIKSDAEFGESGTAIQTDYTQVAQAIKSHNSTYAPQRPRLQGHRARCARKRRCRA